LDERVPAAEVDWESRWAPYDPPTYQAVLDELNSNDIVLEIGAGDLRLACQMALICKKVYAIEIQTGLVQPGSPFLPDNLISILGDALEIPFPAEITTAVLLMRHCTHFHLYTNKLKAAGCQRLITNARWRMGVETIQLQKPRQAYEDISIGWYACWCGATGFIIGNANLLNPEVEATIHEVVDCPQCRDAFRRGLL